MIPFANHFSLLFVFQVIIVHNLSIGFLKHILRHIDIPHTFHSDHTESLFSTCLGCDGSLLDEGTDYVIEKAYRTYPNYDARDTIFEYALCIKCLVELQQQMSKESLQRIQSYFERHVDFASRFSAQNLDSVSDIHKRIDTCIIKGTPIEESNEYQLFGLFQGTKMLLSFFPYAIGGKAMDEIAALLSNKTLGEIDGFMDEHFSFPPELRKLFLERPTVLF